MRLLWALGGGCIAGIYVRTVWDIGPAEAALLLVLAGAFSLVASTRRATQRVAPFVFIAACAFVLGMWRT